MGHIFYAGAKINLGLSVLGKRPDGFHDIQSVFYPIAWHDVLEFIPSKHTSLHIHNTKIEGDPHNNIVLKAYRLLAEHYRVKPYEIHLLKNIPIGAGLAGGSSDAVCVLKAINQLEDLKISQQELLELSAQLGSDCPFFMHNTPCFVSGRGEVISQIDLSLHGLHLGVVYPDIMVSSKLAYQGIDAFSSPYIKEVIHDKTSWKKSLINDFESSVFSTHPPLKKIKKRIYNLGAVYASLTGSGSAIYGLFESKEQIISLRAEFKNKRVYTQTF